MVIHFYTVSELHSWRNQMGLRSSRIGRPSARVKKRYHDVTPTNPAMPIMARHRHCCSPVIPLPVSLRCPDASDVGTRISQGFLHSLVGRCSPRFVESFAHRMGITDDRWMETTSSIGFNRRLVCHYADSRPNESLPCAR